MRTLIAASTILLTLATTAGQGAQSAQSAGDVFRSSVDLIVVNVVAVDRQGRPVEDLTPRDFAVKIDGRARDVVSAQLVKASSAESVAPSGPSADALVTTNVVSQTGRRVAIAVDQTLVAPGSIAPVLRTAGQFVDRLTPLDQIALVAFPEPGPRIEFTTDKVLVHRALEGVVGQPQHRGERKFNISLTEARDVNATDRMLTFDPGRPVDSMGLTTRRILQRGCRELSWEELLQPQNRDTLRDCVRDVNNESFQIVSDSRTDANISLRALESFVRGLASVDGPKSMILISAGLALENESLLDDVVRLAAAARTSINVIAVDVERDEELKDLANGQSRLTLHNRSLELQALETIADHTGGSFQRAVGSGEGNFKQLTAELSASYIVAVEHRSTDPSRQKVDVEVKRRGVAARWNRTFVTAASLDAGRPREDVLTDALSSSVGVAGVPLRLATFTRRDPASSKYNVQLVAQIGQADTPAGDFTVGHLVLDKQGHVVASRGRQVSLSRAGSGNQPLHFDTEVALAPGSYSLRFGVVDAAGRRGTIVRPLELGPPPRDGVATSDLVVGSAPAAGEPLHFSIEPHVDDGRVAAYLELYLNDSNDAGLSATMEIVEGDGAPPLTTAMLNLESGAQPNWRIASGALDASILPGRYVARVSVRRGTETLAVVSRPFVFDRTTRRPAEPIRAVVAMPRDLQRRAAAYVSTVVSGLTNVVAEEDFVLERPDKRVTSDFLLVRYPGSERDFLTYRDVMVVNGKTLPGREQRLVDLFLKPTAGIRERAQQITSASYEHVPSFLNPMFVIAFLQEDFQWRFQRTIEDAGSEWPAGVKVVTLVETARPTLLRQGPLGDRDVPTRAQAWIEEGTGRILQTALQIGSGQPTPRVVTKFALDPRLQIVVPEQMRTENPKGVATYSNYRRFRVDTDTKITPNSR